MSIEKDKADLLDWYMGQEGQFCKRIELQNRYSAIVEQKTLSENPYINEIMSGRLLNIINDYFNYWVKKTSISDVRLSELPHISRMWGLRGFGKKTQQEYTDVMTKYGFTDKLN